MEYTRLLKQGMAGTDVRYMKDMLFDLKYYAKTIKKITNNAFGADTTKAVKTYQTANKDISGKKLIVDGIIGKKTWQAIERDWNDTQKIKYTRLLKEGMSGKDVRYMKNMLFDLSYYSDSVKSITNDEFGADTKETVKLYQQKNRLTVDGIIGPVTWKAIETSFEKGEKKPKGLLDDYIHIAKDKREKIEADLVKVSDLRQKIVLEILKYTYDYGQKEEVRALYIFGENLYNTDLKLNIATEAKIIAAAARHPAYFSGGRKEWMIAQVRANPNLPASDCSGMEVGYLRERKRVSKSFDATANALTTTTKHSTALTIKTITPGDWVGYEGHIGTYVGGGYVVEFAGGAFGCQLTKVDDRYCYDFITRTLKKGTNWTRFRKPVYY